MNYSNLDPLPFSVNLPIAAHKKAEERRSLEANPERAEQVYLKTLAEYATDFFLRTMLVNDLETVRGWEYIAVAPYSEMVHVPSETRQGKTGFIFVQFDESLTKISILGFADKVEAEEFSLEGLRAIDEFPEYLQLLYSHNPVDDKETVSRTQSSKDSIDSKINFATQLVLAKMGRSLDKVQECILQQALEGKKLGEIKVAGYGDGTVQRVFAPRLWQLLSEATGEKVTIRTVQLVLANAWGKELDKPPASPQIDVPVDLGQWLKGKFSTLWKRVEDVISQPLSDTDIILQGAGYSAASHSVAQSVERAKLVELGNQDKVALIVTLTPKNHKEADVFIEVKPARELTFLPANLELTLLAATGETLSRSQSGERESLIQLERIPGELGDSFSIRVALDNFEFTEHFIV